MQALIEDMIRTERLSQEDAKALQRELDRLAATGEGEEVDERNVLRWLAAQYSVPYTDLDESEVDRRLLSEFPARLLLKHEMLPLRRTADGVQVATSRLFATDALDTLATVTTQRLIPVLAPSEAIRREMKRRLGVGADTLDTLASETPLQVVDEAQDEDVDLDSAAEDASIIRFVNQVLGDAIALRATDVHLEPFEDELRIRYRIDGVLQEVPVPSQIKRYQAAIVSRVKIISHLDIAEKRLPQDGRIKIRVTNAEVDVRVSVIPMLHGEAVVLRLLRQDSALRGLPELRMAQRENRLFRRILRLPHGIILVTGPTGSGKTTTLYAALSEINESVRKIITIEDPIEYHLKGINQIQVSEKAGLTFARGLRSILRHDPDVVLVGEIRDPETAQIAVQASLTGHLVFSTLHTNDAPGALTRLVDMGVEPYLVASSLEAVLAQRLVRVLCEECKRPDNTTQTRILAGELGLDRDLPLYEAAGCEACRKTGFLGRRGVFEMMEITEDVRRLILGNHSTGEIREAAKRDGLASLSEDGLRLVHEGVTTVEEVLRVTRADRRNGDSDEEAAPRKKESH